MHDEILIVEDSPILTKVLKHLVTQNLPQIANYCSTYAETAALLEHKSNFLVAILDLNLPDAPNGEVIDLVMNRDIPIIVLTATFDQKKREQILARGAVDYVTKESRSSFEYVIRLIHRLDKNRSINALIVDDGRVDRVFLRTLLELQNFNVIEAKDGREALKVMEATHDIKLVITDYHMPEIDGIALISELRRTYSMHELVIIGLSASGSNGESARFLKNGANDFLNKPFSHEEFFVRIMQNIDALEYMAKIRFAAERDYLTGLYNRRYFTEHLSRLAGRLTDITDAYLAIVDLDLFKTINDRYGHQCGDAVLQNFASLLITFEGKGTPARLGGEEFAVLLTNTRRDIALSMMEALRQRAAEQRVRYQDQTIQYTISIGLTALSSEDIQSAMSRADKALYAAKQSGRNKIISDA